MPGYPEPALDLRWRVIPAAATVVSGFQEVGVGGGASPDRTAASHRLSSLVFSVGEQYVGTIAATASPLLVGTLTYLLLL